MATSWPQMQHCLSLCSGKEPAEVFCKLCIMIFTGLYHSSIMADKKTWAHVSQKYLMAKETKDHVSLKCHHFCFSSCAFQIRRDVAVLRQLSCCPSTSGPQCLTAWRQTTDRCTKGKRPLQHPGSLPLESRLSRLVAATPQLSHLIFQLLSSRIFST